MQKSGGHLFFFTGLIKLINNRVKKIPCELRYTLLFWLFMYFLFHALNLIFPLQVNIRYSTIVTAKNGTVIHAFLTPDDKWRMYTELHEITPRLEKTIRYKEDKYFYYHFGINPLAIIRALYKNILHRKRTSGASTISMQVARLLEPKQRTYSNKLVEMFRALQLENRYTKQEILQLYLNLIPYSGNIEGVKAASILYFDKLPDRLSIAELTALSIIPNRPQSLQLGENNIYIKKERNKWLKRFESDGLFSKTDIEDACSEPLHACRHEAPKLAPHFSYYVKSQSGNVPIIKTSLNLKIQTRCEKLVKNYINKLYYKGIKNAAVLIINNKTKCIEAYLGSADFYNSEDAGQVDGIQAIRSPGSTLKPLLYALSFEEGIATPKTVISDVPVSYSGYEPENYDGKFHGDVTVEECLAKSLNVPAVKLLNQLRPYQFIEALKSAGFQQIKTDEPKLGLSVVLGGCGVTLYELTTLYCAFANAGKWDELKYLQNMYTDTCTKSLISPASCYMITEILTGLKRPDLPLQWYNSAHLPKVAWKTGTSYGRRDAWSIGYNKTYTVGVWVGNFSGVGVQELNGANSAAPLLFKIFNTIDYDSPAGWYTPPKDVEFRLVCSATGLLPNDYCKNLVIDSYIPTISSNKRCNHLKEVWISPDSSISYCTACLPSGGYIKAMYRNFSPEMINYCENYQIAYDKIPPHNPDCERIFYKNSPQITSPVNGLDYYIDVADSTEILLKCNSANDVDKVYWYINNRFYQSAGGAEKVFFVPDEGYVKISCTDDKGRNSDIVIHVHYIRF